MKHDLNFLLIQAAFIGGIVMTLLFAIARVTV